MRINRLVDFPYVLVRLRLRHLQAPRRVPACPPCGEFGSEILLHDLLLRVSAECPWHDDGRGSCGVRYADLPPRRPPDMPAMRMRVIGGGKS